VFQESKKGVHSDQDGEKLAIFYKIFTHRPVIDLCASSPKKYAETPAFIHRMNIITQSRNAKSYSRQENNHWRVVAWDALRNSAAALAENQEILKLYFTISTSYAIYLS